MAMTSSGGEPHHATSDREIVLSRVISAPRELVFEAFTQVSHLSRWWGPDGFSTTARSFEFSAGLRRRTSPKRHRPKLGCRPTTRRPHVTRSRSQFLCLARRIRCW